MLKSFRLYPKINKLVDSLLNKHCTVFKLLYEQCGNTAEMIEILIYGSQSVLIW